MAIPVAAIISGISTLSNMNKNKAQIEPVALLPKQGGLQQPLQPPQSQQMGIGSLMGGVQGGTNVMGALDRRKELVKENPRETLKTGLDALETMPDLNPDEKNMYLQKIYEAYQKAQNMG